MCSIKEFIYNFHILWITIEWQNLVYWFTYLDDEI